MLITTICILAVTLGGVAITYLFEEDESLMWRIAAGSLVGSAVFGLIAFIAGCLIGFNTATIIGSTLLTMLPALLFRRADIMAKFKRERDRAKGKMAGANSKKLLRFAYYAFYLLVFWLFFARAVYETREGIYTGGSQNLGDLPFHLGAIFGFTDGNNFPPTNPSFAGSKFTYPFISDFLTACYVKIGAGYLGSMFVQNVTWAFALLIILERFATRITNSRLAGRIAPALLFFGGGLGFYYFFEDAGKATKGFVDFMMHLPRDYTIGDHIRWGNAMVVLFVTQRGILMGLPFTLIVLTYLWNVFAHGRGTGEGDKKAAIWSVALAPFVVGMIAGMLPLIHVHSLVFLFFVTATLFAIRPEKWPQWIAFGIGVSIVAIPELIWTMTGTASETSKFLGWHFGWDKKPEDSVIWFWFKNTGIFIPATLAALALVWLRGRNTAAADTPVEDHPKKGKKAKIKAAEDPDSAPDARSLLLFFIPFGLLFIICNVFKFAPWAWDNVKILIYWWIGSAAVIGYAVAWLWQKGREWRVAAIVCLALLTFSGALDVWRQISGYVQSRVFDNDAIAVANQIKQRIPPNALFLNAPTYNSAVVLSGRPSLMRYSGHLGSYGIDYGPREADVRRIYQGGGVADLTLQKYNIDYVLVSPEERNNLKANEDFFRKFPVAAESGQYRVYKVK